MSVPHVLITGGYGCIGAETAKWLLRNTFAQVVVCSRDVSEQRTERVFSDVARERLTVVAVDVRDQSQLASLLSEYGITHVAHLAALQTPDCNAHRDLGLQINVAGTQNLIEALKSQSTKIERFVFASSIAVYGPRCVYPPGIVPMLAAPQPVNVYGVWKLAGEWISKLYFQDTQVPTLCLRPGVLFGPGRDAGLTSSPTTAMKCVALGLPYEIPFRSRQDYLYAPDVGAAFAHALIGAFEGFGIFTLPSHSVDTEQFVTAIKNAAKELEIATNFSITVGRAEVPFISELDYAPFIEKFPRVPHTPLADAVRQSLSTFIEQRQLGWLTEQSVSR